MRTKTVRARGLAAPMALLLSMSAACHHGGTVTAPPPTSAPAPGVSAETSVLGVVPAEALLEAAEGLDLTVSQREKVRALKDQLAKYAQNTRVAFRALCEDLADQVRAGAILPESVRGDEDRAAGALTIQADKGAETLNALHRVLDPSQRAAAAASVRVGERAILDAFVGAGFDGWTMVPAPLAPPAATFRQSVDREVSYLASVVPGLRQDQRQRLAATIENRAGSDGGTDAGPR